MKRLLSILISAILLLFIYWKIDLSRFAAVLRNCDLSWLALSLSMVIPLTALTAWRLQQLMPSQTRLKTTEANRLILAASTLNMVLPSKMGDIAKAYFMTERGRLTGALAFCLVVFEKACDMLSLLLWCAFGLLLFPAKGLIFWAMTAVVACGLVTGVLVLVSARFASALFTAAGKFAPQKLGARLQKLSASWADLQRTFRDDRIRLLKVSATSIFIWFLHLLQIWFFILALKATAPFLASLALSPLAILAGLLPLTFAGVGTRDAALILFYDPFFNAPTAAALGLLCTSRYLLPAIGGLPFLGQYLASARRMAREPDRI